MRYARRDGLILVFLGATVLLLLEILVIRTMSQGTLPDFISGYYSARCLFQNIDPYNADKVLQVYRAEQGKYALSDDQNRSVATRYIYPPTALSLMAPFALLPWEPAHLLWTISSVSSLILAAFLMFDLCALDAPILGGLFIAYLLANSEVITVLSNPSEIGIGLCVIGVWSFIRERFIPLGILCLALSLAIKPQDSGLVWLFFLLAGGVYRKRALLTLLLAAVLTAPFVLWVWRVSPNWIHELHGNLLAFSGHGGLNDPGPASKLASEFIDLRVVFSRFYDSPSFYVHVSYLVVLPLLLMWAIITLRVRQTPERSALALAAIAPLSLLPVYHHLYDTKLLLLVIPALALTSKRNRQTATAAVLITGAAFFFTADISRWLYTHFLQRLEPVPGSPGAWMLDAFLVFPPPCLLLTLGCFYLWLYWRFGVVEPRPEPTQSLVASL